MRALSKQTSVYQGLFLISLGLYAYERNLSHPLLIQKEMVPQTVTDIPSSPELDSIYKKLKVSPVFATPLDGLTLTKSPRTIRIELQSDEIYHRGEIAVEETWLPVLDQIGNALFANGEPKADLIFAGNAQEDQDSFSVSSARGEWLLRYLNRKYQLRLDQKKYRVMGYGKESVPRLSIVINPEHEF